MRPKAKTLRETATFRRHNISGSPGRTPRWRRPTASSEVHCLSAAPPISGIQPKPAFGHRTRLRRSLQIVLLSDTHELFREVDVPDGDILLCAGDWTMQSRSLRSIVDFNKWLGELPHRHKIGVPGNHETYLQTDPANRSLVTNAILLINEGVEIEGLRIWGSPVTPVGPAFAMGSAEERRRLYTTIPAETEVLITHGPPYGILDSSPDFRIHGGDRELYDAVRRVKPLLHVFGHIHGGHGIFATEVTTFVNAALLGPDGDINHKPVVLRIPGR